MKIERSGDLVFWTYHMVDWRKVGQNTSDKQCVECHGPMNSVEQITDSKGLKYDGLVCHSCKRVIWFRSD